MAVGWFRVKSWLERGRFHGGTASAARYRFVEELFSSGVRMHKHLIRVMPQFR